MVDAHRREFLDRMGRLAMASLASAMPRAATAERSEVIQRIKAAVVGVGTVQRTRAPKFRFLGTGFAVGDGSLIATNAHVLPAVLAAGADPEALAVVLPGADADSTRVVEVSRAAVDDEHDLALLRMRTERLPAAPLLRGDDVREGDELLFTGFPIGAVLGPVAATHRAMLAAVTPIVLPVPSGDRLDAHVVRGLRRGAFAVYQLDGTAYPGSSGSPLYEPTSGEVVGIVNMVFVKGFRENALTQPSGISYAIPVRHLRALIDRAL